MMTNPACSATLVCCMQAALKREAAALSVEEQLKDKEAIEAENAAAFAKIAENEAQVPCASCIRKLKKFD